MAIVSTRPGIKVKVGVRFPAQVTVDSPLTLSIVGASYTFGVDTSAILGGDCWVWQLKMALASIGQFYTVDDEKPADKAATLAILWSTGGRTSYGDTLSTWIEGLIGTTNTQTAYTLAPSMIN